jgi:hypothetical protein
MRNTRHPEIESRPMDEMQLKDGFQRRKSPKRTDVFGGIRDPAADLIEKTRQKFAHKIMYGEYTSTNNDRDETSEGLDQMDSREDITMAFEAVEDTLDQALEEFLQGDDADKPDLSKRRQETRISKASKPNQGDIFDSIMGKVEAAFCLSSDIPATSNPWPVPIKTDILDEIFHIVESALCLSSSAFDKTSKPNQGDILDSIMGKVEAAFCLSSDIPVTSNPWPVPSETDILDEIFHRVESVLCLSSPALDKIGSLSLRNDNVNDNLLDGNIVDGRELDALDKFFEGIEDAICPKETAIIEEAFADLKEDWYLGEDIPFDCIVESKASTSKELAPARTQSFQGGLMTELVCFSACTPKHEALSIDKHELVESLRKLPGRSHPQVVAELENVGPSLYKDPPSMRNEDTPALLPQTIFSERCRERFEERCLEDASTATYYNSENDTTSKPSSIQSLEQVATIIITTF